MTLSILNDFCTWWPLWWLFSFLLGLLLGRILWGKYKNSFKQQEESLNRHKSILSDLENELKKCKNNGEQLERKIRDLERNKSSRAVRNPPIKKVNKPLTSAVSAAAAFVPPSPIIPATPSPSPPPPPSPPASTKVASPAPVQMKKKEKPIVKESKSGANDKFSFLKKTELQIIEGIGPKMEKVLNENGITNWVDLSRKTKEELRSILDKYDKYKVVNPKDWAKQASLARGGKWNALIEHQKKDGSNSKLEKFIKKHKE